jgi:hypothetical protein
MIESWLHTIEHNHRENAVLLPPRDVLTGGEYGILTGQGTGHRLLLEGERVAGVHVHIGQLCAAFIRNRRVHTETERHNTEREGHTQTQTQTHIDI